VAREPFNPDLISAPAAEGAGPARGRLTVSQVTTLVRQAIESALPSTLHVVGEISNFKRHSSGHLYLTLKDRSCELSCVMWRSSAGKLKFNPADGMEVVATGAIEVFERAGRYQLYIRKLEPLGVGELELAFRQLCEKLDKEGLFAEERKRPLPMCPQRIVLVTSPTGAAVLDMLRTIERRYPCVHVLLYPVAVQGAGAAEQIASAIRNVNANDSALGGVDLMIVGRGGGSLEDLWSFNEEVVARAIHSSRIPIISAVGHEVDVTIADLVADVRAATPTAAAEQAVPVLEEVLATLTSQESRLWRALGARAELARTRLGAVQQRRTFREPAAIVQHRGQVVDELFDRTYRRLSDLIRTLRRGLDRLEPVIQQIAPHRLLLSRTVSLHGLEERLRWAASKRLTDAERAVSGCGQQLDRASPASVVGRRADHLRGLTDMVTHEMRHQIAFRVESVRRLEERLAAMGHQSVLDRGFSITRIKRGRKVVRSADQVKDRQRLVTQVSDGEFESEVLNVSQLELFE